MKRLRILIAILILWLFIFYNIERLNETVIISDVAYAFVLTTTILTFLIPRLSQISWWVLLTAPIPAFLVFKVWLNPSPGGLALPLTVTEICAIVLTLALTRWASMKVCEFESAIVHITLDHVGKQLKPYPIEQSEMYREVRRARNHQRPLALMAIRVSDDSIKVAIDRMVREVEQTMIKHYVLSSAIKALCEELEDYNIVAQYNDHFLVLLPEATPDKLPDLVQWLNNRVCEQVGVTLQIGVASLPQDALTFDGLVDKAVQDMTAEQALYRQYQNVAAKHVAT